MVKVYNKYKATINISLIMTSLILSGCVEYEAHGHYKFDERRLKEKMKKEEVVDIFGTPLKITENDDIWYYLYSHIKKTSFGINSEPEHRIMRLEFKNNVLFEYAVFDYVDYVADKNKTEEPDMAVGLLFDIVKGGVQLTHSENVSDIKKNFK